MCTKCEPDNVFLRRSQRQNGFDLCAYGDRMNIRLSALSWEETPMSKITVLLAEDHHLIRAALVSFLAQEPDFEVIGEVWDGSKIIDKD